MGNNKQFMTEWMDKIKELVKNKKILLAGGVVAGLIIIIVLIATMTAGYTVDLSKVYEVQFEGLDGEGEAKVVINEQEQEVIANELGVHAETPDAMANFLAIEYEIVPSENLSNGDKVKVIAKYSERFFENYKVKIKKSEQEFTVKGLVVPEEIDVFDGLQVKCEGISPFITCTFDIANCGEFAKEYVDFDTTKSYYSREDKIEVVAKYDKDICVQEEVKPVNDKKEYAVDSKSYYLESIEDVDLTSLQDALSKQLKLEYDSADELFCGVELGWTNHYTEVKDEQKKDEICLVLREASDFDDETPYNIYGIYYRIKIGVEHRSRGNEDTFDTEMDVLLLATNLYVDENNVLHYDNLIQVKAEEVEGASNLMSKYIKEQQGTYKDK